MNPKVSDIMFKNFIKVGLLDSVKKLQQHVIESNVDFFPVYDEERLKGVVTYRDLIGIHPNRIVADAMNTSVMTICHNEQFWKANILFNQYNNNIILVKDKDDLVGVITSEMVDMELSKHIDSLTGLYKSSYIYFCASELIKQSSEFSIVFIDVNNFGVIDKKFGHVQGDETLKALSRVFKDTLPQNGYLCRFAGDEFVILLSNSLVVPEEYVNYLIDRINDNIFPNEINVEISAGIYNYKDNCLTNEFNIYSIINEASLACTKAKKNKEPYIIVDNSSNGNSYGI